MGGNIGLRPREDVEYVLPYLDEIERLVRVADSLPSSPDKAEVISAVLSRIMAVLAALPELGQMMWKISSPESEYVPRGIKPGGDAEMVGKFRKKPVIVEAMQWPTITPISGEISKRADPFHKWIGKDFRDFWRSGELWGRIKTLEGDMEVSPSDWIIKGVAGEFYPCKPNIFEMTYEPVEEA